MRNTPFSAFLFLFLISPLLQATDTGLTATDAQKLLGVPLSIARVVRSNHKSTSRLPDVILIQDIHRHPEVQGHIAAILLYGTQHWGLERVYIEGVEVGKTLQTAKSSEPATLREALYQGQIGGAEIAAAIAKGSLRLEGLEDPETYKANVMAYEQVDTLRKAALRELQTSRMMQSGLDWKDRHGSDSNLALLQQLLKLRLKPVEYAHYLLHPYRAFQPTALSQAVESAELFYMLADKRSSIFTDILTANSSAGPQVAVVGGFHTEWMTGELRKRGKSYLVLSPQVTQSGYDELYAKGMIDTISALKLR